MATDVLSRGYTPQVRYSHVLLDEAQDTWASQLAFLQAIALGATVVTAVGDADQTIYGWRGSRADMLGTISQKFGCMPLILPTNYRCCTSVVDLARAVIQASPLREQLPLLSSSTAIRGEVRILRFATREDETDAICRDVYRATCASPNSPIAILCRTRNGCKAMRRALKQYGIQCSAAEASAASGGGGADCSAARVLLAWLQLVLEPNDNSACLTALASPPRTGFASGETSAGVRYLQALAAIKSTSARRVSILVAAVHAARNRWARFLCSV